MAPEVSRKRQGRLTFTPAPSSSPQRSEAHVRVSSGSQSAKRRKIGELPARIVSLSPDVAHAIAISRQDAMLGNMIDTELNSAQLPTPEPSSQLEQRRAALPATSTHAPSSTSEDEPGLIRMKGRTRRRSLRDVVAMSSSEDSDPPHRASSKVSPTRTKVFNTPSKRTPDAKGFLSGGSSGNAPISDGQRRKSQSSSKKAGRKRRVSNESTDDDSLVEELRNAISPKRATKHKLLGNGYHNGRQNLRKESPVTSSSPGSSSHDDDEEIDSTKATLPQSSLRNSKKIAESLVPNNGDSENEEDSDDIVPMRSSRRNTKMKVELRSRETSDLEEDADFLRDSELRDTRTRGRPHASARDQRRLKLEELKEKRMKKGMTRQNIIDIEEDGSQEEDPMEVLEEVPENPDEYESDFVEEDDNKLGINLATAGVPLHLTNFANQKPIDYFRQVVEWMVHNKLDPAFERNDEIYQMAYAKLDDEVAGHAKSTFNSSAWTASFVKALNSRPEFLTEPVNLDESLLSASKCEACNRGGHPPKYRITFTGNSYDKKTLERISHKRSYDDERDSEDDDSSEEAAEEKEYFLVGRFCYANAEIAHTLHHWRFQLNQNILAWLGENGHLAAGKVVQRENWSRKKREKYANKIVDGMNESGEMKAMYRIFKRDLEAARSAKAS